MAEKGIFERARKGIEYYSNGIGPRCMFIYSPLCAAGAITGGIHDMAAVAGLCAFFELGSWGFRYSKDRGWLPDEIEVERKPYNEMKEFAFSHGYEPATNK